MTTQEFKMFVRANVDWFRGRFPHSDSSLLDVEKTLGVEHPASLKWLLREYGYWHGTAISNIDDSVSDTLAARRHHALPNQFVVLENKHDGGIVLIDTGQITSPGEFLLHWIGTEDLGNPPNLLGNTRYESYGDYVKHVLPSLQDLIDERFIRYNSADFPEGQDEEKKTPR